MFYDHIFLHDWREISFYSSMRGEMTDKKNDNGKRKSRRKKTATKKTEAVTHYLQTFQFFKQRVKKSEINRLRKTQSK